MIDDRNPEQLRAVARRLRTCISEAPSAKATKAALDAAELLEKLAEGPRGERESLLAALRFIANEPRSDAPAQLVVRFQRIASAAIAVATGAKP
jgi:hypothetical protein